MNQGDRNALWVRAFLDQLARAGVREVCVAPGSRSTPLVLAAAEDGRFRMFSIIDERAAGFFALGIGKATGRPAAVITTSGTAAANLYPSVVEASQGEVPLLVITADRPHRLRDTDGNQAMDQLRLFGPFARAFFEVAPPALDQPSLRHLRGQAARAVALSQGPPRGPVHLNFPFDKPLEPVRGVSVGSRVGGAVGGELAGGGMADGHHGAGRFEVFAGQLAVGEEELARVAEVVQAAGRGLIVAGPVPEARVVGPAVLALAAATGFPVLADPLSGARFSANTGDGVIGGYDLFLRSSEARKALSPEVVLRVGAAPTSSALLDFLSESEEATQVVVDDGYRWKDHLASAHHYVRASPAPWLSRLADRVRVTAPPHWRELWADAEARTRRVLADSGRHGFLEGEILAAVVGGLPAGANLLVASSMPIRDLDAFSFPAPAGLNVFGNRGVSGIDGLVSTTVGIAIGSKQLESPGAGEEAEPPTVGVLGDLAFLHDMNGLQALRQLAPRVVLVVINNDGGGIFHTLPVREFEPAFTRFFATPHGLDFEKAAGLYGIPFSRAGSLEEFRERFPNALDEGGPGILEIRTHRERTHEARRRVVDAVVQAMGGLGGDPSGPGAGLAPEAGVSFQRDEAE